MFELLARARVGKSAFDDISRLMPYVFPSFGEGVLRFSPDASKRDPFTPSSTNTAQVERFLEFAYEVANGKLEAALAGAEGTGLDARSLRDYTVPKLLSAYFERFLPDKAPAFRERLNEAFRRVPTEQRPYLVLTEPGSLQELLSRADSAAEPRLKYMLYQRAIDMAANNGDLEKASGIVERLSEEGGRSEARKSLSRRMDQKRNDEAWSALNKGDYDRAESLIAQISDWYSEPLLLISLIGQASHKDKARAIRILDEYERQVPEIQDAFRRPILSMELAGVAANLDPSRGFDELKVAIAEFNRAGFVAELQRYRDDDTAIPKFNIGVGGLLGNWHLFWLGMKDFDRAVALTQQIQMREAAAVIKLAICEGALRALPARREPAADSTRR